MKKPRGRNLDQIIAERKARRLERLRAILFAVVGLALVGAIVARILETRRNPNYAETRSVIVPLDNRTGDGALDALGLVASDWITRGLSIYSPHETVPTTTSIAYAQSAQLARYDLLTRARELTRGTRAQIMVWGSFYRSGDSLRFNVEVTDRKTSLMVGSIPQIAVPIDSAMLGVDILRAAVVATILRVESRVHPSGRIVPRYEAYAPFVNGLRAHAYRDYASAAAWFEIAEARDSARALPGGIWLSDALVRDREFARADTALRRNARVPVTRSDNARGYRALAVTRNDLFNVYAAATMLADYNPADDLAAYEAGLTALAVNRAREARRIFGELHPNYGALRGRPELYLHHAAAYHILGNHGAELGVVRDGRMARPRTIAVRLATCRVRAALGKEDNARIALDQLAAGDTDTTGVMSLGYAFEDCAAELDAHGLPALAKRAHELADGWYRHRPRPTPILRDTTYEKGYVRFELARDHIRRGDLGGALNAIRDALYWGLPYYEPGRVMLHADTTFRRLRNTRGFLRINQPRG